MSLAPPTALLATPSSSLLSAPSISTTALTGAKVGSNYSFALSATGGIPPYSWSIDDGALPPGLSLSSVGVIAGTPTLAGSFAFTVLATDAVKQTASVSITMVH